MLKKFRHLLMLFGVLTVITVGGCKQSHNPVVDNEEVQTTNYFKKITVGTENILAKLGSNKTITLERFDNSIKNVVLNVEPIDSNSEIYVTMSDNQISSKSIGKYDIPLNTIGYNTVIIALKSNGKVIDGSRIELIIPRDKVKNLDIDTSFSTFKLGSMSLLSQLGNGNSVKVNPVPHNTSKIILQAIPNRIQASITVKKGNEVISGNQEFEVVLDSEETTITVQVKAADGKTLGKLITVTIPKSKAPSAEKDTSLSILKLGAQDLLGKLAGNTSVTAMPVDGDVKKILNVNTFNPDATIIVKLGQSEIVKNDDGKYELALTSGINKITVDVTSKDGSETKQIIIEVQKYGTAKANLNNINIDNSDSFYEYISIKKNTYIYSIKKHHPLDNGETRITIKPEDNNAKIRFLLNGKEKEPHFSNKNRYEIELEKGNNQVIIIVENGNEETYNKKEYTFNLPRWSDAEVDVSLKSLSFNGRTASIKDFTGIVSRDATSVEIVAETSSADTKMAINDSIDDNSTNKVIKTMDFPANLEKITATIYVKSPNGTEDEYTCTINRESVKVYLKNLSIQQDSKLVDFQFKQNAENIYVVTPLPTVSKPLQIIAESGNDDTTIQFDHGTANKKTATIEYTTLPAQPVKIVLSELNITKTYFLHFSEKHDITELQVRVISAVTQSEVKNTTVTAYEYGVPEIDENRKGFVNIIDGYGSLQLNSGKYYTLVAKVNGRAGSRIENLYVEGNKTQKVTMIQRERVSGAKTISPKIVEIKFGLKNDYNNAVNIESISELDSNTITENQGLFVKILSSSAAIPNKGHSVTLSNFGLACNIGATATLVNNISIGEEIEQPKNNNKEYEYLGFLPLGGYDFPTGEDTIYIVAYDMVSNRVERQIRLNFIGKDMSKISDMTGVSIKDLYVELERMSRPMHIYSTLPRHDNYDTTYYSKLDFFVQNSDGSNFPISGFDLYRRVLTDPSSQNSVENIRKGWELVGGKKYSSPNSGYKNNGGAQKHPEGMHVVRDTDSTLEEGLVYQYKIVAYSDAYNSVESPIATTKLMPAFNIKLESPSKNKVIQKSDIDNLEFKFKISNPNLWSKNNSDLFVFGLLVVAKERNGNVAYATKMRYNFNKDDSEDRLEIIDLSIKGHNQWKTLSQLKSMRPEIPSDLTVSDILQYDSNTGIVTITQKYLQQSYFEQVSRSVLSKKLKAGETYFWDIQDWGKSAANTYDDMAAYFKKSYPLLDSNTGDELSEYSVSVSSSNGKVSNNAINGRLPFSISE